MKKDETPEIKLIALQSKTIALLDKVVSYWPLVIAIAVIVSSAFDFVFTQKALASRVDRIEVSLADIPVIKTDIKWLVQQKLKEQ